MWSNRNGNESSAQWFEIQSACRAQSSLRAPDKSLFKSYCCAAGHVASGPGPSLRTAPAFAIPKADDNSAGGGPDVLIMLLLGILSHSRPGGSPEPVASWPQLGLRPPQTSGLLCCFFPLPRASATYLSGSMAIRKRHTEHQGPCTAPLSSVETEADHPKGHCSCYKKLGQALLHREQLRPSPQHREAGLPRRLFLSRMYEDENDKEADLY